MSEKLRPVVTALALILALGLYVTYCHDPQVRAGQRLRDSTVTVDAHRHETDARVARMVAESSMMVGQLRRFARNDSVARVERARLRVRLIRRDSLPESADTLQQQIAVRDSIIDAQDSVIVSQDSALTLWKALAIERGTLLTQALGERDSYRRIAIAWQGKANRKFGCTGGPGVVVTIDGHVSAGAGFVCGIRF